MGNINFARLSKTEMLKFVDKFKIDVKKKKDLSKQLKELQKQPRKNKVEIEQLQGKIDRLSAKIRNNKDTMKEYLEKLDNKSTTVKNNKPQSELAKHANEIVKDMRNDYYYAPAALVNFKKAFNCRAKFTKEVWGNWGAPVFKCFDRSSYVPLRCGKGDECVIIFAKGLSTGNPMCYLCFDEDEWYYVNGADTLKIINCITPIKVFKIAKSKVKQHIYEDTLFLDALTKCGII